MRKADGTFEAGNPGKPKGSQNKLTQVRKKKIQKLVEAIEKDYLEDDLAALTPRDRIRVYMSAQEFLLPKMRSVEINDPTEVEEILAMSPEERAEAIRRIKEKINNGNNGK